MEIVFQKLLQTFEHKASLFWHIKYFEQYIAEDLNPKGLRVQVFHNIWASDLDFRTRWERNLHDCSNKNDGTDDRVLYAGIETGRLRDKTNI